MTLSSLDVSLLSKIVNNKLSGLTGVYVDDSIHAGCSDFLRETDKTLSKFEYKERNMDNFTFAGVQVKTVKNGILLHENQYAETITPLPADCSFRDFRSKRQQLSWLTQTRLGIATAVNQAAQVTEQNFNANHTTLLNKVVKCVRDRPDLALLQQKLDKDSLFLRVYTDSSFANNEDLSTQLAYLVLLGDKHDRCNVLHYSCHKSRRKVRSVMSGEVYPFTDGLDFALTLKFDLERIIGKHLPLSMVTDSKQLFDVLTKNSTATEKRLMIDIETVRGAYQDML